MPDRSERPVSTGEAAKVIGVHRATLTRWWAQGKLTPAFVTPGGQARWLLTDLRKQLAAMPKGDAADPADDDTGE